MRKILVILLPLILVAQTFAQSSVEAHVLAVDSSSYPQVKVYLGLRERQAPILNLTAENVIVDTESGQAMTVESVAQSQRPLHLVVVMDVTGSVSETELANQAQAVRILVEQLDTSDQLGLVEMDDQNAQMIAPLQNDATVVLAALDTLTPRSDVTGNVYWDGVNAALTLLAASPESVRRAAVVMSDVGDGEGGGNKTEEAAVTTATSQGIEVYGIYFEHEDDGIPDAPPKLPAEMTTLSEMSGGLVLGVAADLIGDDYADDSALPVMMGTIAALLTNETELTLSSPLPADGSRHQMNIRAGNASPVQAEFAAGDTPITITFGNLTDRQGITPPQNVLLSVSSTAGSIESLAAFAVNETGQRIPLGEIDPAAPNLTLENNLPDGLFRLLIEASDSAGNRTESSIFLNQVEEFSVTLVDVPATVEVNGTATITARIGLPTTVQSVAFRVDGVDRELRTQPPFDLLTFEWTPDSEGEFVVEVLARDANGATASQTTTIEVRAVSSGDDASGLGQILVLAGAFLIGLLVVFGVGSMFLLRRRERPLAVPIPSMNPSSTPPTTSDKTPEEDAPAYKPSKPIMIVPAEPEPPPPPFIQPRTNIPVAELLGEHGERWTLYEGENTIGRHGANHISLRDESASRYHAKIEATNGKCVFYDWQASHPSEINGKLLEPNKRYDLKNGDTIRVGSSLLRFTKE